MFCFFEASLSHLIPRNEIGIIDKTAVILLHYADRLLPPFLVMWLARGRPSGDAVTLERALELGCDFGLVLALLCPSCVSRATH